MGGWPPLCTGRLWQRGGATFSGVLPCTWRRRSSVHGCFVSRFLRAVFSRRLFCFVSGVGSLRGGFAYAKLATLECPGRIAYLATGLSGLRVGISTRPTAESRIAKFYAFGRMELAISRNLGKRSGPLRIALCRRPCLMAGTREGGRIPGPHAVISTRTAAESRGAKFRPFAPK